MKQGQMGHSTCATTQVYENFASRIYLSPSMQAAATAQCGKAMGRQHKH
jgi:hypothetical protein